MTSGEFIGSKQTNALQALESIASVAELTPAMVQDAINFLDADSTDALTEAEIVLGFATFGRSLQPDSEEWYDVLEKANKIYQHRLQKFNG